MEGSKLYVGNLSYSVTSEQLKELFGGFGEVGDIRIIEGKGFGFVEMATQVDAEKAKKELDGSQFMVLTSAAANKGLSSSDIRKNLAELTEEK